MKFPTFVMASLLLFTVWHWHKHPGPMAPTRPSEFVTNTVVISAMRATPSSKSRGMILKDESTGNIWVLEDEDPFLQDTLKYASPGEYIRLVIEKKGSTKRIHSILPPAQ